MYKYMENIFEIIDELSNQGYNVKIQKDLPVIDDLIQVYVKSDTQMNSKNHLDINIYRPVGDNYIRHGIHESTNSTGKKFLNIIRVVSNDRFKPNNKIFKLLFFLPNSIRAIIGYFFLKVYTIFFKSVSQSVPVIFFNNFKKIHFLKMNFLIPKNTEEYLKYRFGSDWKTPNKGSRNKWVWPNSKDQAVIFQNLIFLKMKFFSKPIRSKI